MTDTEDAEKAVFKILDILGNVNVIKLEYDSDPDGKTKVHWITEDGGANFEHNYEFGWKDKK